MHLKVLLLEDDEMLRNRIKAAIDRALDGKVEVFSVGDASSAYELLDEHDDFDLLITDVMMNGNQPAGLDVAALVTRRMSIVVISAFAPEQYGRNLAPFGRLVFLTKSAKTSFQSDLIAEVRKTLDAKERRSACLQRHRGTLLAVRFHLPHVPPNEVPLLDIRDDDFLAITFGSNKWQEVVESNSGRVFAIHGQTMLSLFTDDLSPERSDEQSIQSFLDICEQTTSDYQAGFDRCPFSAACIAGLAVSGVFGIHPPGASAIVGRTTDLAQELAKYGRPRELAVVEAWLAPACRAWFHELPGARRAETLYLRDVTSPVEVTFLQG